METKSECEPPMQSSDEATQKQLDLARAQGDALLHAVETMTEKVAHGEEQQVGDYLVGFAVEKAEGLYQLRDGVLEWREPEEENVHVEIVVRDAADGRFLPGLTVYATLIDARGNTIGMHRQPFLWHPWVYHYGRNWKVPGDGEYTIRVHVDVPEFPRHDKKNGRRYSEPADVTFEQVQIETGRK